MFSPSVHQHFHGGEWSDLHAEGPSMLKKMKGLLDLSIKSEVDYYEETVKYASNVLAQWSKGDAAGKKNLRTKY